MKDDILIGERIRCWDFEGTGDRFTILYMSQPSRFANGRRMFPGMNSGLDPQGISGHIEAHAGAHLGRRVAFEDLPEAVRAMVRNDINKEET